MKYLISCIIFFFAIISNVHAQVSDKELTGRWKFVKMEMPGSIGFDLDNLTSTYKKFFNNKKHNFYHDKITTNDSLYINTQFEKLVNDVNRMFITFKSNNRYETNGYNKSGDMTDKPETGTYFFDKKKNIIYAYRNGNKKHAGRFKVVYLDKAKLVIIFDQSSHPAVFTCTKVKE